MKKLMVLILTLVVLADWVDAGILWKRTVNHKKNGKQVTVVAGFDGVVQATPTPTPVPNKK